MNKSLLRRAELVLIERALEMLTISKDDLTFFLAYFTPFLGRQSRLRIEVESADLLRTLTLLVSHSTNHDVLDYGRDDLLACPEHFGFHDSRRHSPNLLKEVLFYQLPHTDVDKLHVMVLSKEGVLRRHEDTADH